ncbi:minor tail protein [Mycobacterium phage Lang]|uniref:Minor tail protein n=1 Tax=Mycobacterium phage Lang TaxID=2782565 RepID=A0A7S7YC92_9CAUD|nr:minor tail protein [Mycobacterium phage Lang]
MSMLMPAGYAGASPKRDPIATWNQVNARRRVLDEEAKSPSLYRLWDKRMNYIGTVHTHKAFDAEEMQHDTGEGTVVLRGSDWLVNFLRTDVRAEEDLNFTVDPYPHRRNWRWRWGFKVTDVEVGRSEDGEVTVTLHLMHNREHWKHILFGATVFAPPEAQPIKCFLLPANCRTAVATAGAANLARLFNPALAVFTNLLNPGAYVGAALGLGVPGNFSFLNHPIQMQFVNPITDTSRLTVLMSRWQDAHSVTEAMLRDAGCQVRAYTWLEEDEDSPHPELAMLIGEQLARPRRNCIVLACEERAQYQGITGLLPDGAIKLIAATGDDLITNTLFPEYDENGDGVTDPLIRRWFGAAPAVPSLVFRDGPRSAIVSSSHHMYKSKAKHIMTGGRSPSWVCPPLGNAGGGQAQGLTDSTKFRHSSFATRSARSPKRLPRCRVCRRSWWAPRASRTSIKIRATTCFSLSCATPTPPASCARPITVCSKSSCKAADPRTSLPHR